MFFLSVATGYKVYKKTNVFVAALIQYCMLSFIYVYQYHANIYVDYEYSTRNILGYFSAVGMCCFLLIINFLDEIKPKHFSYINKLWGLLCLINIIYVLGQWLIGNHYIDRGGLFGNGSINACFIAFTFPFAFYLDYPRRLKHGWLVYCIITTVLCAAAILCTLTSVPVGTLIVVILCAALSSGLTNGYKAILGVGSTCFLLMAGYCLDFSNFFSSAGRFDIYRLNLIDYIERGWYWLGTGLGTFPYFSIKTQQKYNYKLGSWHTWLHNDWQQMLIEGGIIGLGLMALVYFTSLYKCKNKPILFASMAGFGASAVFNYPVHYPLHALFLAYLILVITSTKEAK